MVDLHCHNEASVNLSETPASDKPRWCRGREQQMSFPLEFPERGDDVARTVFVEQFPPRLFASPGLPGRLGKRCTPRDEAAHFASEVLEVAALILDSASPIADDRAMPGNNALGGHMAQLLQVGEKAANAAIDHRHMPDEQEITGKQRGTLAVEDRQIIVGMRGRPGLQSQYSPAEIKLHLVVDDKRGRHNLHFVDQCIAEQSTKGLQVKLSSCRQRTRQIPVPDKDRPLASECGVAKQMIRMNMRVDDVANRP